MLRPLRYLFESNKSAKKLHQIMSSNNVVLAIRYTKTQGWHNVLRYRVSDTLTRIDDIMLFVVPPLVSNTQNIITILHDSLHDSSDLLWPRTRAAYAYWTNDSGRFSKAVKSQTFEVWRHVQYLYIGRVRLILYRTRMHFVVCDMSEFKLYLWWNMGCRIRNCRNDECSKPFSIYCRSCRPSEKSNRKFR